MFGYAHVIVEAQLQLPMRRLGLREHLHFKPLLRTKGFLWIWRASGTPFRQNVCDTKYLRDTPFANVIVNELNQCPFAAWTGHGDKVTCPRLCPQSYQTGKALLGCLRVHIAHHRSRCQVRHAPLNNTHKHEQRHFGTNAVLAGKITIC